MRVSLSDVSRLGKFQRTGAGAFRIPATTSRTGVQEYPGQGPDGGMLRAYRPDSEVFSDESLASFASVPVTIGHPVGDVVTLANMRDVRIGHVSDLVPEARVKIDGSPHEWVRAQLVVEDGELLREIDHSGAHEISCGYTCDIEMTDGVAPDGTPYNGIQRNIRMNHVAILNKTDKPRAGGHAKLRLDNREKDMIKIVIDGVEYEKGSDSHISKIQADAAVVLKSEKDRADKAEAKADAAVARADKAELASQPDAIDALVSARHELLQKASSVLPATYDTKGKTDSQIRLDSLVAKLGADAVAGKSDVYLEARFDGLFDTNIKADWAPPAAKLSSTPAVAVDSDDAFRAAILAQDKKARESGENE